MPSHVLLMSPTVSEGQKHALSCRAVCKIAPILLQVFFNNGKAPSCFKAWRKFISQVLFSGKGEGRQSNYLPRQENELCMSNQHIWMAEDIRHQPNLGPASFTCSGTPHTAQIMYSTEVIRNREGQVWDFGSAFDFHLHAEDSIIIRCILNEETQT